MDLSKLPKLSDSQKNAPLSPAEAEPGFVPVRPPEMGVVGQVILAGIIGLILMMLGIDFAQFVLTKMAGQTFHTGVTWQTGDLAGQEVEYFELQGYTAYSHAAIFLFGLAMVLEALVLSLVRRNTPAMRTLVMVAFFATLCVTLFNLIVAGMLLSVNIMPIWCALAVAYGVFLAIYEWQLLLQLRAATNA